MMKAKGRRSIYYMNGSGISMITFDDVTSDNFFPRENEQNAKRGNGINLIMNYRVLMI